MVMESPRAKPGRSFFKPDEDAEELGLQPVPVATEAHVEELQGRNAREVMQRVPGWEVLTSAQREFFLWRTAKGSDREACVAMGKRPKWAGVWTAKQKQTLSGPQFEAIRRMLPQIREAIIAEVVNDLHREGFANLRKLMFDAKSESVRLSATQEAFKLAAAYPAQRDKDIAPNRFRIRFVEFEAEAGALPS